MGSDQSKSRNSSQPQHVNQENYGQRSTVNLSTSRPPPARPPPPHSVDINQTQASKPTQRTTISTERQRNPYTYLREEIPQPVEHLYPTLRTGATTTLFLNNLQQSTNVRPKPRTTQENGTVSYENARAWIDNHYPGDPSGSANINGHFAVVDNHFRCQPSAPPAPPSPSPSPTPQLPSLQTSSAPKTSSGPKTSSAPKTSSGPKTSSAPQTSSAQQRSSSPARGRPRKPHNRNHSSNRNHNNNNDVRCETCNNIHGIKIFQCDLNHSSCQICKQKQIICGKCSGAITNKRNWDLEKFMVVNNYKIRCPNAAAGCSLSFMMSIMNDHQKECPFRDLKCPIPDGRCNWQGKITQLSDHFEEKHPSNQAEVDTEIVGNICGKTTTVHLIKLGKFNFLLYTKVDRKVYMAVQHIGTKISALKWNYEVHIYNKREPRRKFQYTDYCRSYNDSVEEIMEGKCVVLPLDYAMTFIAEGNLTYKCFIKKEFDNRNNNRGGDRS